MKIGILTFHFGTNYGGILQCYALYNVLTSQGHEVEVIDYKPQASRTFWYRLKKKIKSLSSLNDYLVIVKYAKTLLYERRQNRCHTGSSLELTDIFDDFRKTHLTFSPKVNEKTITTLEDRYDVVIVGSDQVWSDIYDDNLTYFFDWIPKSNHTRRMAYAACSCRKTVAPYRKKQLKALLERFDVITVRDSNTQQLVQSITGILNPIVADPTQLYDFKEFLTNKECKRYILVYILDAEIKGGHKEVFRRIKDQYGEMPIKLIQIPNHNCSAISYADEILCNVTPQQWVDLFANAGFIYTDSFHAIMFAMKFKKPLLAYYTNPVRATRLIDLKTRYPFLQIVDRVPSELSCEYEKVNIGQLISNSLKVLKL